MARTYSLQFTGRGSLSRNLRRANLSFFSLMLMSFVYNQIRKMVAMMVAMIRDGADPTVISACFAKRKKVLPLAPALGLFLFRVR